MDCRWVEKFIEDSLPGCACVFDKVEKLQGSLFSEELPYVKGCADKRVREFVAGRTAARETMKKLGLPPLPVLMGRRRMPVFPAGVVGSISHSDAYCICILGRDDDFRSIGVDIENITRIKPYFASYIFTKDELVKHRSFSQVEMLKHIAVVFCAKEAYFKFQYPITGEFIGFKSIVVDLKGEGRFDVIPLKSGFPKASGSFIITENMVIAFVAY